MPHAARLAALALLAAAALAPWSAARAATLQLVFDQPVYHPGDTVTLHLVGDSQGALDWTLFAIIEIDRTAMVDADAVTFAPPSSTTVPWLQGSRGCDHPTYSLDYPNRCILINMIAGAPGVKTGVDPAADPFTYAVVTATAGAPGVYPIDFITTPSTQRVDFFGLTSAPGTTLVIINPEPGTAALLALGLAGLAIARRRRPR